MAYLTRYDPFREALSLRDAMDRLFQESYVRPSAARANGWVPMDVEGRPMLRGPTAIDFAASRVAVLRLGLPEFAVRRMEARINPLIDLTTMPLPLHLTTVEIEGDRAVIAGTASLKPAQLRHP